MAITIRHNGMFTALSLMVALLTGCTTTLPIVAHTQRCDASETLLALQCAAPQAINDEAKFTTLVDTLQADRQSLRECALAFNALRDSIKRCNQAADDFNKKIDEINAKNKAAN